MVKKYRLAIAEKKNGQKKQVLLIRLFHLGEKIA
jgi:hypothetical protein